MKGVSIFMEDIFQGANAGRWLRPRGEASQSGGGGGGGGEGGGEKMPRSATAVPGN